MRYNFKKRKDRACPIWCIVLYIVLFLSIIIWLAARAFPVFADFFNENIGSIVRLTLGKLTMYLPFSLAESIIILLPVIIVVLFVICFRANRKGDRAVTKMFCILTAVVALLLSLFFIGFASGYHGSGLASRLGLEERAVSAEELYNAASAVKEELDDIVGEIKFKYGSFSIMPYSLDEMNKKLNEAFFAANEKYPWLHHFNSNIKYILLSRPMTYTHISGVYTFYTGEANLNINFPDYTLPYTAAHELSHQRGISPEDEANFMAFLVCIESEDPYIRYSGYMNMYEYLLNALYTADPELYRAMLNSTDYRLRYEMIAYSDFFDEYRESKASEISETINDTYLKAQGQTHGSRSYGKVVDLAVAYYNSVD